MKKEKKTISYSLNCYNSKRKRKNEVFNYIVDLYTAL